jgi:tetratricopeptide (TPR) repeat protein
VNGERRIVILICVALVLLTLGAYWRVLGCQFVDYDDATYVTANRWVQAGPTLSSVKWALTALYAGNWHPLTWISHMLDWRIYGANPLGHHLTNLILHALSALLLFLLIRRMTGSTWRSAFVAALFAVHPLHVESVAWVAERKDVLSTLLWILIMHAYVSYVRHPGRGRYMLVMLLFVLGLAAKPMLVTVPLTLLLLDYWPLGRLDFGKPKQTGQARTIWQLAWEKTPFLALSGASCVVTFIAQQRGSAVMGVENASIGARVANALVSYVAYLVKMFWPAKLAVLYPHPFGTIPTWQVIGSALLLVAISILVLRAARTRPYLAVGWLWYIITLIPVIGLVQVGVQAMADRYTYIPLIGIFIALAWGIADLVGPVGRVRQVGRGGALVTVLVLAAGTWHQTGYWKDSLTLFQRAVDVTERNFIAETGLGVALNKQGETDEAIGHFERAIEINPGFDKSHYNLATVAFQWGETDKAVEHFTEALRINPDYAEAHHGLGLVFRMQGQPDEAEYQFQEAIRLKPDYAEAHNDLGALMAQQGRLDEAMVHLYDAVRYAPGFAEAHCNLAFGLALRNETDAAIAEYERAIEADPDYVQAHGGLAVALYTAGRYAEAWEEVRLCRQYGANPPPGFIKALEGKMPEPGR